MNVIFLDFDGVLDTAHYKSMEDIEKRIVILSDICKEYNCYVVIEASAKGLINEDTLEVEEDTWVYKIFELFKKYSIKCIGRTPNIEKKIGEHVYLPIWKEDEILKYLECHPEIKHYCILDDDDLKNMLKQKSDLDKVRDHLVETIYYSQNSKEEGLLPKHKEKIRKMGICKK